MSEEINQNDKSEITLPDNDELANLIIECVSSVEGVSKIVGESITESISNAVFGRDPIANGVTIEIGEFDQYKIIVHLRALFGYNIPQLSYDIQSLVKNSIEQRFNIKVNSVNIIIEGID